MQLKVELQNIMVFLYDTFSKRMLEIQQLNHAIHFKILSSLSFTTQNQALQNVIGARFQIFIHMICTKSIDIAHMSLNDVDQLTKLWLWK